MRAGHTRMTNHVIRELGLPVTVISACPGMEKGMEIKFNLVVNVSINHVYL